MKMKGDLIMKPSRLLGFLDLALGGALFLSGIYTIPVMIVVRLPSMMAE